MSITSEELVAAIHDVADGETILTPQLAVSVLEASRGAVPEEIEQEILLLIASGYTYEEIAARLHLSIEAIGTHVASVLRRLGAARVS
jgi:DNA-binding NarL/FixJ family response regulator